MAHDYVLIIEPNFTGHRWRYVEWVAHAYMEIGYRVLVVTEAVNRRHELVQRIEHEQRPDLWVSFDYPAPHAAVGLGSLSYVHYLRDFRAAYEQARLGIEVKLVVVPYVDYFFFALPFLGSPFGTTPWLGITMRAAFHHGQVGVKAPRRRLVNALKAQLFKRAARTGGMKTLFTIDPTLPQWCLRMPVQGRAAIEYLADPFPDTAVQDPLTAKKNLGLGAGPHVLVYGVITARKGIVELVRACAQRCDAPTLVIAGELDDETRAWLAQQASHLAPPAVILDRYISSELELALFSACDAVWLGYKGHYGMSGVLVQAYRFGKPVIATAEGLIGWFCKAGDLGPVLDNLSAASINRALDRVLHEPPRQAGSPAAANGHLLARNTLSQFKRTLQHALF
jgi:glycosyltransferase involved in cell wall biosynthesis